MVRWVHQHIVSLSTPCGEIAVTDEKGRRISFSVKENPYHPDHHLFYGTENEEVLNTDTNYLICIQTRDLTMGQPYQITLSGGQLHDGGSDEHTAAVSGTLNGYSIAIGAYDPNEEEKLRQACKHAEGSDRLSRKRIALPAQYDESRFIQYDVGMLENYAGFAFRLLGSSIEEIVFPVAWVRNKYPNLPEYEDAVELWTT